MRTNENNIEKNNFEDKIEQCLNDYEFEMAVIVVKLNSNGLRKCARYYSCTILYTSSRGRKLYYNKKKGVLRNVDILKYTFSQ